MRALAIAAIALAVLRSGWMTFDGIRALTVGDYVTPSSGEHAGQLGPWSHLVKAVGIEPRSTVMKALFVFLGLAGLVAAASFGLRASWGWAAMVGVAFATLWYLPLGTVSSAIQLVLLWLPVMRAPD